MIRFPLPSLQRLNAIATLALSLMLTVWVLLALAAVFVLSLGTDEAWVLNGLRSLLHPVVPHLSSELVATNGGPFALINIGVEAVLGSRTWVHRAVSAAAIAGACLLIVRQGSRNELPVRSWWLGLAVLISVPGLAELGTAALGTSVGLLLMLSSMLVWTSTSRPVWVRVALGGALYGLAATSRFDLVLFGPAVLLAESARSVKPSELRIRLYIPSLIFVVLGVVVFLANLWVMSLAPNAMATEVVTGVSGVSGWSLDYPRLLNHWAVLSGFAPPALLAILAISGIWSSIDASRARVQAQSVSFATLLVITGLLLLVAWFLRAPIPHLRYAFPALFCLSAAAAIAVQRIAVRYLETKATQQLFACQCLCIVCAIGGVVSLTRSIALSDSDYLSWEWSHEMAHDYFRRFESQADQRQVATYIRERMDPDVRLYSAVPFALRYLTNRPVVDVALLNPDVATTVIHYEERYFILTPATGTYFYLRPESATWLGQNARMIVQFGRYSIYKLDAGTDEDLRNIKFDRSNYRGHPESTPWFGRS